MVDCVHCCVNKQIQFIITEFIWKEKFQKLVFVSLHCIFICRTDSKVPNSIIKLSCAERTKIFVKKIPTVVFPNIGLFSMSPLRSYVMKLGGKLRHAPYLSYNYILTAGFLFSNTKRA